MREYLEAAFDELRRSHGSLDAYIEDGLGISKAKRENMRAHLLE